MVPLAGGEALASRKSLDSYACLNANGSIFFFFATQHMGSSFPNQGMNPRPLYWKLRVLTTGLPGKSQMEAF